MAVTETVSVAFETNGRGYIGYVVELPGAFLRGRTEKEALSKVNGEIRAYTRWLGIEEEKSYQCRVVQRHRSSLMVEDADNEILFEADKGIVTEEGFCALLVLALYSGGTFFEDV